MSILRLSNMSVRLGATTKRWDLNKYRDNGDTWKPGRSREPRDAVVKEEPTDTVVKEEYSRSRRHAMDWKHRHSLTPSRPKVKEENRHVSPQPQTEANKKVKWWFSLGSIICWIAVIGAMAWFASHPTASVSDLQPHPLRRSVLQSHDLANAKSRVNTVGRALNRPPSGLTLDNADGEVSFN